MIRTTHHDQTIAECFTNFRARYLKVLIFFNLLTYVSIDILD